MQCNSKKYYKIAAYCLLKIKESQSELPIAERKVTMCQRDTTSFQWLKRQPFVALERKQEIKLKLKHKLLIVYNFKMSRKCHNFIFSNKTLNVTF